MMDMAIGTSSSRTVPVVKTIGTKTQIVVSVDATIEFETCFAPWTAARAGATPRWRRRMMFSMTTMELSTSMPMPSERPDSVMMFRERSEKYIRTSVNRTESGMLMPTMIVGRMSRRNSARTRIASSAPSSMLVRISCTIRAM